MFISEDEANRRLGSSENILRRVNGGEEIRVGVEHTKEPPLIIPDDPDSIPEDDLLCKSASEAGLEPSGRVLMRILGMIPQGRKLGEPNLQPEIRAAVATCAQLSKTQNAADAFGVSYHHADELKHGFHHQAARYGGEEPRADLKAEIDRQKKQIRDLAFEKLTKALGLISDEKLVTVSDPTKLSRIAKDLSQVHDKALPREEQANLGGLHFHVWKPEMRTEESYEVVTVGKQ